MKKLIVLFLFAALSATAQDAIFKTVPSSTITIDFSSYVIDGVSGRVVQMPLTLADSMSFTVYLQFYRKDAAGQFVKIPRSEMNADREDFEGGIRAASPVGITEEQINAIVDNIMRAMVAGTPAEKWQAYNAIMSGYGAPLLPLAEQ